MSTKWSKQGCGLTLVAVVCAGICLASGSEAAEITPSTTKNYVLRESPQLSGPLALRRSEGSESLRVDQMTMFTSNHPDLVRWRKRMDKLVDKSPYEQAVAVNDLVNRKVRYRDDVSQWDKQDTWGYPLATAELGGDCEDSALLKGVCLAYLGWPGDRLFLLFGMSKYNGKPESHAVLLAVLPDGAQLILDIHDKRVLPPMDCVYFAPMMAGGNQRTYSVTKPAPR